MNVTFKTLGRKDGPFKYFSADHLELVDYNGKLMIIGLHDGCDAAVGHSYGSNAATWDVWNGEL